MYQRRHQRANYQINLQTGRIIMPLHGKISVHLCYIGFLFFSILDNRSLRSYIKKSNFLVQGETAKFHSYLLH